MPKTASCRVVLVALVVTTVLLPLLTGAQSDSEDRNHVPSGVVSDWDSSNSTASSGNSGDHGGDVRSSSSSSEALSSSSSSESEDPPPRPPPPPQESSNPPPGGDGTSSTAPQQRRRARAVKLAALVVLVIPVAVLAYVLWRLFKRYQHKRVAEEVKLSGQRQPGEVDDKELGQILSGGDWLNKRSTKESGLSSASGGGGAAAVLAGAGEFDPIAQQAATQRLKRARRRQYTDNQGDSEDNGDVDLDTEGNLDDDAGHGVNTAGPIYASTMATDQPLVASEEQKAAPTPSTLTGAAVSTAGGGGGGGGGAAQQQRFYDPAEYTLANQALMERYADLDAGGAPLPTSLYAGTRTASASQAQKGRQQQQQQQSPVHMHRRQESAAFESILATSAPPIAVGADYHQKGEDVVAVPVRADAQVQSAVYSPAEGPDDIGTEVSRDEREGHGDETADDSQPEYEYEEEDEEEEELNLR